MLQQSVRVSLVSALILFASAPGVHAAPSQPYHRLRLPLAHQIEQVRDRIERLKSAARSNPRDPAVSEGMRDLADSLEQLQTLGEIEPQTLVDLGRSSRQTFNFWGKQILSNRFTGKESGATLELLSYVLPRFRRAMDATQSAAQK